MIDAITGGVIVGADGKPRCPWANAADDYAAYHDNEWGVPVHDEYGLYERLMLEAFQSGLNWLIILRKREGIRDAFCHFDPEKVAAFTEDDVGRLIQDPRIIRNRRKIDAAISNARATIALRASGGLNKLIWGFEPDPVRVPISIHDIPGFTPESVALSKELKKSGFIFVGPTTAYAMMQAIGMVNDHLAECSAR